MKKVIKKIVSDWLPPALLRGIKAILLPMRPAAYEFIGYKWPDTARKSGWHANGVLQARELAWRSYVRSLEGTHPLGIAEQALTSPSNVNTDVQSLYLSFAYSLGLACHNKLSITMLDWGGANGNYYLLSKKLMPMVQFNYSSADLPLICETGRKLLPEVSFCADDSWQKKSYDFVFSSSSLQYLENWRPILKALIKSTDHYMYITRMPFVTGKSFVALQRVKEYNTEYLGWVLNRHDFISFVEENGMQLVREFVNHPGPVIQGAPVQNIYMGFLFEKKYENKL